MDSTSLGKCVRLTGVYSWCRGLLLVCCLIPFISACNDKPHHVDLSWDPPKTSPVPVVGYNIYRSADEGTTYHKLNPRPIKETTYMDDVIQNGRRYRYMIKSVDAQGIESTSSNTVNVTIPE